MQYPELYRRRKRVPAPRETALREDCLHRKKQDNPFGSPVSPSLKCRIKTPSNFNRQVHLRMIETRDIRDQRAAYALLRIILGANIALHGISRIMMGSSVFSSKLVSQFSHSPLPSSLVWGFGLSLPWVEALFGLLILLGLRTRAALVGGSVVLLLLTFGSALIQDWQAASAQLLYAAVYAALLFLIRFSGWSLDAVLFRER
jgi:thiosulfate dehydrogenase [quinone] large subunit